MITRIAIAVALLFAGSLISTAAPAAERLSIGRTGILCVKEPCPRRGITRVAEPPKSGMRLPIWSGSVLPPIVGDPDLAARIRADWEADRCIVVEGSFDGQLTVHRIVGPCA